MLKKTKCPVCGAQWNEGVYDKCPNCGWVVGTEAPEVVPQKEVPASSNGNSEVHAADRYDVDSRAENIADKVARIFLVLGWIIGIVLFLLGIFSAGADGNGMFLLMSLAGVAYILFSYVVWAFIKMFVNMSRNLFNIKDMLKKSDTK